MNLQHPICASDGVVSPAVRIHLAVICSEMLRTNMHQVFAEAKDSYDLVFITSPSRTADII